MVSNYAAQEYWKTLLRSTHEQFRDVGDRCEMRCRACGDSKKSRFKKRLNFYPKNNTIHCFNCGVDNKVIYYLSRVLHKPVSELRLDMFRALGTRQYMASSLEHRKIVDNDLLLFNNMDDVIVKWVTFSTTLPSEATDWIIKRKILSAKFLQPDFKFRWDSVKNKLVIPWLFNGQVYYFQYRSMDGSTPKYQFPAGFKKPLFGIDTIDKNLPYIFITESAMDAVFIKNCIAVGSIQLSQKQLDTIHRLFPTHEIIIFPDNIFVDDTAGQIVFKFVAKWPNLKFFVFPDKYQECKDVGDAISGINSSEAMCDFASIDFLLQNTISSAKLMVTLKIGRN